jgi:plasmid stability protein
MSATILVSFRVPPELHRLLKDGAAAAGESVSEHARDLLSSALQVPSPSEAPIANTNEALTQINLLRAQLSKSLEAILVATRALTPAEAGDLIAKHFS